MDELRGDLEWQLSILVSGHGDRRDVNEFIRMLDAYIEAKIKEETK
jgi:hypothetical protein